MDFQAYDGRTVLVTGSAGFLGTYLVRRLLAEGARVRGADRRPTEVDGVESATFDLTDPATYPAVLEGITTVFHLAAWIGRPGDDRTLAEALNVQAVADLVKAAAAAGVERFVLVSTVAVYGLPETDTLTEETPLQPDQDDPYGGTKAQGEVAAREAAEQAGGIELVIVRPGQIHGPGARNWTRKLAELERDGAPTLIGAGDGLLFPVFIDNLLDALLLAGVVPGIGGEAFHIVDGSVTWHDWMAYYGRMTGRPPRKAPVWAAGAVAWLATHLPLGIALTPQHVQFSQRKLVFDTTRAHERLGWTPRIDLDAAMARSEAWLREEGVIA